MLKIVVTVCAMMLLCACGGGSTQSEVANRDSSRAVYTFKITRNAPTSSKIYYVWPQDSPLGTYSAFRVIEPIVDIDSYDEHNIEGTGPDGSGRFKMRVLLNQSDIAKNLDNYFLVSGL